MLASDRRRSANCREVVGVGPRRSPSCPRHRDGRARRRGGQDHVPGELPECVRGTGQRRHPGLSRGWATTSRCRASRATMQRWRRSRARACSAASRACEARHPSPVAAEANGVVSDTASRRVRGSTVRPRAALRGRRRRAGAAAAGRATTACRRPPATCRDEGDEHEASSHVRSRSARSQVRGNRHHIVDGQIGHRAFHELRCRAGACAVLDVIELAHDVAR